MVATVAQHPKLSDVPNEAGAAPIPRYACKMATGAGKTVVMSMLIAWAFCNRGTKPGDPRYPRRVLVKGYVVSLKKNRVACDLEGRSHEDTDVKHQAARRWVSAVNHWGRFGEWCFLVCRNPQLLDTGFENLMEVS